MRRRWFGLYLALLVGSGMFRRYGAKPAAPPEIRFASVQEINVGTHGSRQIRVAYRDTAPGSGALPVVLVHGSPGTGEAFRKLTAILSPHFRVIAPDLPGFGFSTHDLPDYSFRVHGLYLIALLDALHVDRAQMVGFSMGGGVVLSAADIAPQRVASIVMLSAIGVQEHELLGSYEANHLLHGAQLAALWAFREALPHFGLLDRFPLNVEYARNFYDSDQRPLRSALARYAGPMLIIHGSADPMVPVEAAREHHRIVAQSELVIVDGNHFMVFERPHDISEPLVRFLTAPR